MNCVECGFEIPPGSRFCGRCGMTLPAPLETSATTPSGDTSQTLVPAGAATTATVERPAAATRRIEAPTLAARPSRTVRMPEAGPETVELAPAAPVAVGGEVPRLPSCPQCGYLLQPETRFCNGCGYLVAPAVVEWQPVPAPAPAGIGGKRRWPVFAAFAGAIAVALVGGFVLFNALSGGGGDEKASGSTPTPAGGAIGGAGSGSTPTATLSPPAMTSTPVAATDTPAGGGTVAPTAVPTSVPPTPAPTIPVVIPPTSTKPPVLPTNTPVPPPPTATPTATPTPIPFSAFTFAAAIDAYSYNVGDTGTLCYLMDPADVPYYVVVTQTAPYTMELGEWDDDGIGGGDCTTFPVIADDRPGIRLQVDAYVAGGVLTVQLSATVY